MKKEVLLSLLMTTPVAFPALADISLPDKTESGNNGSAWKSEASSFIDGYRDIDGTGMYCPVGIKSISRTITLPQGEYTIGLVGAVNCKLIVNENSANANVVVKTNKQKEVTGFTVKTGTKEAVSVKIVPVNPKKDNKGNVIEEDFSFNSLDLTLLFNFDIAYNNTYKAAFEKLDWPQSIRYTSNTSDAAVALRKERTELTTAYNKAYDSLYELINAPSLDTYIKYELWSNPNALVTSTKALSTRVNEYNEKVEAENTRYDNYRTNTNNKNYYTNQQSNLVRWTENLGRQIDNILANKNHQDYQYVKDQKFAEQCAELAASLPAIKDLINKTYAEELLGTEIDSSNLADQFNAAYDKYEELSSYLNGASADKLAYDDFKANNTYLNLYKQYQQALVDLSENPAPEKSGYPENAFAEKVVELTMAIDADFKAAQEYIKIEVDKDGKEHAVLKNIAGASVGNGNKAGLANDAISKAQQTILTKLGDWKTFTDEQNGEMKTAYGEIASANTALANAQKLVSVPSQFKSDYDKLVSGVQSAIAAMKVSIDNAYGTDLVADATYATQKAKVADAQKKLDKFVSDAETLSGVYAKYNSLKESVKKVDVDGFVAGLYANDYAEIDAMFAALKKINDAASIAKIDNRIAELNRASEGLVDAFKNANVMNDYNSFLTYMESGKTILDPASTVKTDIEKAMKSVKVPDGVTKVKGKIDAIIAAHTPTSVMDTYNSIVALKDEAGLLKAKIAAYRAQFTQEVSAENLDYAQAKLDFIQQTLNNAAVVGKESKSAAQTKVDELQGKINTQKTAIDNGNPSKEADYKKIDTTIKDTYIAKDIPAIEKLIQKTIDNYQAYLDLTDANTKLNDRIVKLAQLNVDLSKAPAVDYYRNLINRNAKKTGYYDKVDAFKTQIDKAGIGADAADEKKNAAALQEEIANNISTFLKGTVEPMFDAIPLNESAHNEQLQASERVRIVLADIEAQLKNTGDGGNFRPFADQIKKFSEDLLGLDRQVTAEYGKGASNALSLGGIVAQYDNIEAEAKKLLEDFVPSYNKAVEEENTRLLGEFGWDKLKKELADNYNNSVKTFIDFAYNVTNLGYKAHIEANGGFDNIQELFDYQPKIGEIQNKVLEYVTECNSTVDKDGLEHQPKLITEAGLNAVLRVEMENGDILTGTQLRDRMKEVGDRATVQANQFALTYWNILYPTATSNYDINKSELEAGGVHNVVIKVPDPKDSKKQIDKTVISVLSDALKVAKTGIDKAKSLAFDKDGKLKALGTVMNEIADNLDKSVLLSVTEKQTIAMNMWVASHKATTDRLAEMNAAFAGFDFVTAADKKAPKAAFDAAVAEIGKLNTAAVKVNEGLLGTQLNDFMTKLETEWNKANTQYTSVETKNATNKLNKELFDKYTGNVEDLLKDFKALCNECLSLAADNSTLAQINNRIEALETLINDNKADYSSVKTAIENEIKDIKNTVIPSGYGTVAGAEVNAIRSMISELRSSWAEASKDGKDIDLDDYRDKIDTFEATHILGTEGELSLLQRIANIEDEAETVKDQVEPFTKLFKEMRTLEDELAAYQIALKKSWGKDVLGDLIKNLSDQYIAIDNKISSLSSYDESLQKEYADTFTDYKTRLDAVKDAWEDARDKAIMQENNYTDLMTELSTEVDNSLKEVKKAQDKIDAHKAAYADLKGKYDAQVKALEAIKDRLAADDIFFPKTTQKTDDKNVVVKDENGKPVMINSDQEAYRANITAIEKLLAETLKDLNKQNEKGNMTSESVLKGWSGTDAIPTQIKELNNEVILKIEGNLAEVMASELRALYADIQDAKILPDVKKAIIAKYIALGEKAKTAIVAPSEDKKNTTGDARIKLAVSNIAAVHAILDEANALVAEGEENTFKPGDLDRNGDVDILDVQEIITLVGEAVAYGDLDAVKAAAADTNGDGIIGVGDIAGVITEAMKLPEKEKVASRIASRAVVDGANIVSTEFVSEEGGVRRFAVNIANAAAVVAGQVDLVLADGMTLVEVVAADRAESHDVALFHHGIANKRVVLSNMDNAAISGVNGAVIYVDVIGDGQLNVDNVIFADKFSGEYRFAKPDGTSGIEDTVIDNNGGLKQRIYNAAGQALRGLQRGVNIIRNADGSVSKEYHK